MLPAYHILFREFLLLIMIIITLLLLCAVIMILINGCRDLGSIIIVEFSFMLRLGLSFKGIIVVNVGHYRFF